MRRPKEVSRLGVMVTGASGFVGGALCRKLSHCPAIVLTEVSRSGRLHASAHHHGIARLDGETDWQGAFETVDVVIHCAARAHVMRDDPVRALSAFRKVNVEGTGALARAAAEAGVRRFIFISSVKAQGECSRLGQPLREADSPAPEDPYGLSKLEAERALREIAAATGMEFVIIRPPLVYGPGVRANFLSLMKWLDSGLPLPLGAINNKRSLVALDNLVDLIVTCIEHPAAANEVFLVSDGRDLSTSELLRYLAKALGKPSRLVPVPERWLAAGGRLLGRADLIQRLCLSLQVDIGQARSLLGWSPPLSVDEALQKVAHDFRERRS